MKTKTIWILSVRFLCQTAATNFVYEVAMALVAEQKYPKEAILEAYLNEIYLGQRGARGVYGVAAGRRGADRAPAQTLPPTLHRDKHYRRSCTGRTTTADRLHHDLQR